MPYYLLKCFAHDDGAVLSNEPDLDPPLDLWNSGMKFSVLVPEPLNYSIDEDDAGEMLPLFNTGSSLLMTDKLVEALRAAGVDNFDEYLATIFDKKTGTLHDNYRAVNIIGVVRAADMTASSGEDVGLVQDGLATVWFDKLVIDESHARGMLLFRLAERLSNILVHESVKKVLEERSFDRLEFVSVNKD